MIKVSGRFASAILLVVAALTMTAPAPASARPDQEPADMTIQSGPSYRYCSADTFTGWVKFWYIYNPHLGFVTWVGRIEFRIDASEANDRGSIYGRVNWNDEPLYAKDVYRSRQNGQFQYRDAIGVPLTKEETGGYPRHYRDSMSVTFSFHDQAQTHRCTVTWTM